MGIRVWITLFLIFSAGGLVGYIVGSKVTYAQLESKILHYDQYGELVYPDYDETYDHRVFLSEGKFSPKELKVNVGERIRWDGLTYRLLVYHENEYQNVITGSDPFFIFSEPGTYFVSNDVTNMTVEVRK